MTAVDTEYKTIIKKFLLKIPEIVYGTERAEYILQNIEEISSEERVVLKKVVDRT